MPQPRLGAPEDFSFDLLNDITSVRQTNVSIVIRQYVAVVRDRSGYLSGREGMNVIRFPRLKKMLIKIVIFVILGEVKAVTTLDCSNYFNFKPTGTVRFTEFGHIRPRLFVSVSRGS
jgi:hypothetical protein